MGNMKSRSISIVSVAMLAVALSAPAYAAGGDSDGGSSSTTKKPQIKKCWFKNQVYNKKTKKCEKKEAVLDQDSIFDTGRELAYAGKYEDAITVLALAPNQNDKRVLNMMGYSHRKIGKLNQGIAYYKHSISVDPKYVLVREYYGEALLQKGDLGAAKAQLNAIKAICEGSDCKSYKQLHAAISNFENGLPIDQRKTVTW